MNYAIRINPKTLRAGVHVVTCSAKARKGDHTVTVEATDAHAAAEAFTIGEDLAARGYAAAHVCECCDRDAEHRVYDNTNGGSADR